MLVLISIAIDGPAGAGKSTLARILASKLSYIYVDTGALYRALGVYMLKNKVNTHDEGAISAALGAVQISLEFVNGEQRVILCGKDVTEELRTPDVADVASRVSSFGSVRNFLLELQKDIARRDNVIMDGRDIGTVILPDATVKIFLTASLEQRARRRYDEFKKNSIACTYEDVVSSIDQRDRQDSTRSIAPLKPADDAVIIHNGEITLEESVDVALKVISSKVKRLNF